MDFDEDTPLPKRRRTSSVDSASPSAQLIASPGPLDSPGPTSRDLPLRHTNSTRSQDEDRRLRSSVSDSDEESDDLDVEDEKRTFWRDSSPTSRRPRRRSSSHGSDPGTATTRSSSRRSSVSARYAPPKRSRKEKSLHFKPLCTLSKAHARGITSVKFSPDGSLLATSSADATINIYTVTDDSIVFLKTLTGHLAGINAMSWSASGPPYVLASASDDKSILLWSPASSTSTLPLSPSPLLGHHNYVSALSFSPKGNMLVSGSYDEAVFLWDVRAGRIMRSLPAHSDPIGGVDFLARDGTMVVSCAGDGLIRIWDSSTGQCLKTLVDEDRKPVTSVRFTPNGLYVLAWTLDGCIRLWDYVQGTCVKTYQGHINESYALGGCLGTYMSYEAFVASGSEDGNIVVWDVTSKEVLWRGQGHRKPVLGMDFFRAKPEGKGLLVSGGLDRDLRVWVEDPDARVEVGVESKEEGRHSEARSIERDINSDADVEADDEDEDEADEE